MNDLFRSDFEPANTPLVLYTYFDILYAVTCNDDAYLCQIPRGMSNLKEIEEYVKRCIDNNLPSYTERWSHN